MSDTEKPRPACTNCARRKTRCDRNSPCSSCVAAKVQCHYLQRRPEKKRRVLHSTRYEESLTDIRHQLDALSSTLRSIVEKDHVSSGSRTSHDESHSTPSSVNVMTDLAYNTSSPVISNQRDYEGESSFYSQSRKMADTLSQARTSAPSHTTDEQSAVVQSLIDDARTADSATHTRDRSLPNSAAFADCPELAGLSLPPMDAVLRILAFAKTIPQRYFDYPFADADEFADQCQKLYFPTQPYTIFAWINVNCGLFYLFRDLETSQYSKIHLTKSQVVDFVHVCSKNIEQAIKSLRLCLNPSREAVAALVTAGSINIELASGSIAWKLITTAARMSVDLGYHRLTPGYGDKERSKQRKLFWYVYSMDKALAFNIGRASTIQDYDVTTERPILKEDFKSNWGSIFHEFIEFSSLQYAIFVQLFSATAQQEPLVVRVQKVHDFAARIKQMQARFPELLDPEDVIHYGTEICLSSVLTLIYRILPTDDTSSLSTNRAQASNRVEENHPLQFHSLCVKAGRSALLSLLTGWNKLSISKGEDAAKTFVNWSLHHVPFMPFIAVLGNQIATGNQEDLQLLRDVTAVVGIVAQTNSALDKLYTAFSRLLRIAELWRGTNRSAGGEREQVDDHDFRIPSTSTTNKRQKLVDPASHGEQSTLSNGDHTITATNPNDMVGPEFPRWQGTDMDMTNQDWDAMFNEFDLGLGAETAREMMPWFEQHMNGFNSDTFS